MRAALAVCAALALVACGKHGKSGEPEPAQTAGTIAITLDTCTDVGFCQKRCDDGNAEDCRRLGVTLQMGKGAPKDEARAAALFDKACTMKSPMACVSAGQMVEFAHGVAKDDAKAAAYYKTACDGGYAPGCFNYAIMLEYGRGVAQNDWNAAQYYDIACRAGAELACNRARVLREKPPVVSDGG